MTGSRDSYFVKFIVEVFGHIQRYHAEVLQSLFIPCFRQSVKESVKRGYHTEKQQGEENLWTRTNNKHSVSSLKVQGVEFSDI